MFIAVELEHNQSPPPTIFHGHHPPQKSKKLRPYKDEVIVVPP